MARLVHVPWYATVFRGDRLQDALAEIAPVALRYDATAYEVHRAREDRYRFLQTAAFDDQVAWERYWYGPEFIEWRARYTSCYQVPVVYGWHDLVTAGSFTPGNGGANGEATSASSVPSGT